MLKPAAILIVNNDLTETVQKMLEKQLYISETMDGYSFDEYMLENPNFAIEQRLLNKRLLVIRPLNEFMNREQADIVGFVSHGLIGILKDKVGPPEKTFAIVNLTWDKLF